jgi:hypothetical protein
VIRDVADILTVIALLIRMPITTCRQIHSARPEFYAALRKFFYCHNNLTTLIQVLFGEQARELRDRCTEFRMVKEKFPPLSIFLLSWRWFNAIGFDEFATETN